MTHAQVPVPNNVANRVKRTVLQVGVPAFLFLVVVLPDVIKIVDEELGQHLPPGFRLWMLGAATVLTAISAAATRVMALQSVNDWLSKHTPFGTVTRKEAKQLE